LGILDGYTSTFGIGMVQLVHVNNLINEELESIELLKNQGVDVPLAWEYDSMF
jgi:hypothetical protein